MRPPSVDALARLVRESRPETSHPASVRAARAVVSQSNLDVPDLVEQALRELAPPLRRVLNGTGVLLHTNLGRAPLSIRAVEAVTQAALGYTDIEIDANTGARGTRGARVAQLITDVTGAEDALVVNNGAAAALLAVAAFAPGNGRVAVSRGQLVEIGGGYRIPDVVAAAGATLLEVGTTNRTHLGDYQAAIASGAQTILRVHQSNFRQLGYTAEVPLKDLVALGVPVIDDLGSGVLAAAPGIDYTGEPTVRDSLKAGVEVVTFSGDKLLGGPQAGVLVGSARAIARCRQHPFARAVRADRMTLAALGATIAAWADGPTTYGEIPVVDMLMTPPAVLLERASRIQEAVGGSIIDDVGRVGGGALPLLELPGLAVQLVTTTQDAKRLRTRLWRNDLPVLSRIKDGAVIINPRTLRSHEIESACRVISHALST